MQQGKCWKNYLRKAVILTMVSGIFVPAMSDANVYNKGITGSSRDQATYGTVYKEQGDTAVYDFAGEPTTVISLDEYGYGVAPIKGKSVVIKAKDLQVKATGEYISGIVIPYGGSVEIDGNVSTNINSQSEWMVTGIGSRNEGSETGTNKSTILVKGDVTMRSSEAANPWAISGKNVHGGYEDKFSYKGTRWAPTGIYVGTGKGSSFTATGMVDVAVKGIGVAVDGQYKEEGMNDYDLAVVKLKGGRVIVPDDQTEGWYSLAGFGGTINMNVNDTMTAANTNDVTLVGNMIAMKNHNDSGGQFFYRNSRINVGLNTAKSSWKGVIDNTGKEQAGEINLFLGNGATWHYEKAGKTNGLDAEHMPSPSNDNHYGVYDGNSYLHKLAGSTSYTNSGLVEMKDGAPLHIANYSGHARFLYTFEGDPKETSSYKGGDVIIDKAAANSAAHVLTPKIADMNNQDAVKNTLKALAGKLIYSDYSKNKGNLLGTVGILDGLTSSSVRQSVGNIVFDEQSGKGIDVADVKKDDPNNHPEEPPVVVPSEFTEAITLSAGTNKPYIYAKIWDGKGDTYTFTNDTSINVLFNSINYQSAVQPRTKDLVVQAGDYHLDLSISGSTSPTSMITGMNLNSGNLTWNAKGTGINVNAEKGKAYGIAITANDGNEKYVITGDTKIAVKTGSTPYSGPAAAGIFANTSKNFDLDMEGLSFEGKGSPVKAIYLLGNGRVSVNKKENKAVQLAGDIFTESIKSDYGDKQSIVNLSLSTADSYWKGLSAYEDNTQSAGNDDYGDDDYGSETKQEGILNLTVKNGATWTNEKSQGATYDSGFTGSRIATLTGGNDEKSRGVVVQGDKKDLTVKNYSGYTLFVYQRDNKNVLTGGNVKIEKAANDSFVTLRTSNAGVQLGDNAQVNKELNTLAEKFYYLDYKNNSKNLTGRVELADGLTASSVGKTFGDLSFKDDGQGQYVVKETPEPEKPPVAVAGPIKTPEVFKGERIVDISKADQVEKIGRKTVFVGAYNSTKDNEMVVDVNKHNAAISIDGSADRKEAYGIYVDTKKSIKFINSAASGKLNIALDKTKLTAAAINVNGFGKLSISGDVDISKVQTSAIKAYGIKASGPDIEAVFEGNLKIRNITAEKDSQNKVAKAIDFSSSNGKLTVTKNVDIEVDSIGVESKMGTVILNSGRIVVPMDSKKGQKAIVASSSLSGAGSIFINMNEDNTKANTNKFIIEGDIETSGSDKFKGTVNLGLVGKDSFWHGAALYQNNQNSKEGIVNLWLEDGARWYNVQRSTVGSHLMGSNWMGSHITSFHGSASKDKAGYIFQEHKTAITIADYEGHSNLVYIHTGDGSEAKDYEGGNTTIEKAKVGSHITMLTNRDGVDLKSEDKVAKTLNALANKLFYTNYKDGNLSGTVAIADGLTASSFTAPVGNVTLQKEGKITFTDNKGQGSYKVTPGDDPKPPAPDPEPKPEPSAEGPIIKTETLTKDRIITVSEANINKFASGMYATETADRQHPMVVDFKDHGVTINADVKKGKVAALYVGANKNIKVTQNEAGKNISLTATTDDTVAANGIYVDGNARLEVNAPVHINKVQTKGDSASGIQMQGQGSVLTINGPLSISDVEGIRGRGAGINATGISVTGEESKVIVNNDVSIKNVKGIGLKTVGTDTLISVGGLEIDTLKDDAKKMKYNAIMVQKGVINVNMKEAGKGLTAGDKKVKINGDIQVTKQSGKKVKEYTGGKLYEWDAEGTLNMALVTEDSSWTGAAKYEKYTDDYGSGGYTKRESGNINLWLQNKANWINEQQSLAHEKWGGSQVTNLIGGTTRDKAGIIWQNDKKNLTVKKLEGNIKLIYQHGASSVSTSDYVGGDTHIVEAAKGAHVTVATSNKGINMMDKKTVRQSLNALAGKLYYDNYVKKENNLTGTVRIEEGLTSSSVSMIMPRATKEEAEENMLFKNENGQGYINMDNPDTPVPDPGDPIPDPGDDPQVGDYETDIMRGVRTAITAANMGISDYMKHGFGTMQTGPWARVIGQKGEGKGAAEFTTKRSGIEVGYDKVVNATTLYGFGFTYTDGNSDYLNGGHSDYKHYGATAYMKKLLDDNTYVNVAARMGRLENELTAFNSIGTKLTGDYGTGTYGIEAEIGRHIDLGDGLYVEPQAGIQYTRVQGFDFIGISGAETMKVTQDAYNSLLARAGLEVGKQLERGNMYARVTYDHEFDGNVSGIYLAKDGGLKAVSKDGKDNRVTLALGLNQHINDDLTVQGEVNRTLSGDYRNNWRADLYVKYQF